MDHRIREFVAAVGDVRLPGLFNPWGERCEHDAVPNPSAARRDRLAQHLSATDVAMVLVGEAPGYAGCRYSGLAFSSEALLLKGAIPRIGALQGRRLTTRARPFSEPSATVVWGALYDLGMAERTVLWNACAWHPMGESALSNRTPTRSELNAGMPFLETLLGLFSGARIVAVGQKALDSLNRLGQHRFEVVRHPARGGASEFRRGLRRLVA